MAISDSTGPTCTLIKCTFSTGPTCTLIKCTFLRATEKAALQCWHSVMFLSSIHTLSFITVLTCFMSDSFSCALPGGRGGREGGREGGRRGRREGGRKGESWKCNYMYITLPPEYPGRRIQCTLQYDVLLTDLAVCPFPRGQSPVPIPSPGDMHTSPGAPCDLGDKGQPIPALCNCT